MWDTNADVPFEEESVNAIGAYINDDGSCIVCHDTIGYLERKSWFDKLREHFGLKVGKWENTSYGDYNNQWGYWSSKVKIKKNGSLTTYPWKLGEIDTVLTIPEAHTSSNATRNNNVLAWIV